MTLAVCSGFFIVVIVALIIAMMQVDEDSGIYNVIFALTTGAAGSFFVSIIVELSTNYRNNKLAWQELQDYYRVVVDYEGMNQVLMCNTPSQRAEKKAHYEFIDSIFKTNAETEITDEIMEELKDIAEDHSMDIIEATWKQLPKIIPVLKHTLDEKKAFLNDEEILELRIIIDDYSQIRHDVMQLLRVFPMLYDIINYPDQKVLDYPRNVIDCLPEWMKKHLASNEGLNALEHITDSIMSDEFMLSYFMKNYEISFNGLNDYHYDDYDDEYEEIEQPELSEDNNNDTESPELKDSDDAECDFCEAEDPEEHRMYHIEMDKELTEKHKPFVSWHISHCCLEIAESIDNLEKYILKKPYYGFHLKYDKDSQRHKLDDPLTDISYKSELKRMQKLLNRQEMD